MSEQTPAQRMAEIEAHLNETSRIGQRDARWLYNRVRKLEKVAEHARCVYYGQLSCRFPCGVCAVCLARKEAGYGD